MILGEKVSKCSQSQKPLILVGCRIMLSRIVKTGNVLFKIKGRKVDDSYCM